MTSVDAPCLSTAASARDCAPEPDLPAADTLGELPPRYPETRIGPFDFSAATHTEVLGDVSGSPHRASASRSTELTADPFFFLQEDPLRRVNAMTRTFDYVGNGPVAMADPLGLFEVDSSCKCSPWSDTRPEFLPAPPGSGRYQGPTVPGVEAAASTACGYLQNPTCRRYIGANFGAGFTDCMFRGCRSKIPIRCKKGADYLGHTPLEGGPIWLGDAAASEDGGMAPTIFHEMFHFCGVVNEPYPTKRWGAGNVKYATAEELCSGAKRMAKP